MKIEALIILWLMLISSPVSASGQDTASDWSKRISNMPNRYDTALQAYDMIIGVYEDIDPQNYILAYAWYGKGDVFEAQGKYGAAVNAYDKALEIDPQNEYFWFSRGFDLYRLGRYNAAVQSYDRVIELDPSDLATWYNRGEALRMQGRYLDAIQSYDSAIEIDPKNANAWNSKGLALKALGRTGDAYAAFARAKDLGYKG